MLDVVLLDDEQWTLIYLSRLVDWQALGFRITGMYQHCGEALNKMKASPPDVLIVDISMPEISGIELVKQMHDCGICPYTVILSGFAEFEYAQEAIRLNVLEYCLKPISEAKLAELLMQITRQGKPKHYITTDPDIGYRMKKIMAYIDTHFSRHLTINNLAEQFEISPTYCSKLFSRETKTTFSKYLLDARMREAKKLLCNTNLSVKEIVEQCGYSDYAHFHKTFRKYYNCTVAKYRESKQVSL